MYHFTTSTLRNLISSIQTNIISCSTDNRRKMASNDQSYKIGEAKGQTQEKAGHMMDGVKNTAEQATNKSSETAQAAKAKVSGEKTAGDRANETAQTARDTAQAGTEKTGNAFTTTGDKIKEVAGGATDAVKNTLGMNGK